MARPDNMTTTTPIDPDCNCTPVRGYLSCPVHGKWPVRHIERVGELQETCRVLTELAQQLTNALTVADELQAIVDSGSPWALTKPKVQEWATKLRAALDAAAELGITPTQP